MAIPRDLLLYPPLAGVSLPEQKYGKLLIYSNWAQVISPIIVSPNGEIIFVPAEMYPGSLVTPPEVRSEVLAPSPSINELLVGKTVVVDNIQGNLIEKNGDNITMIAPNGQVLQWTKPTYMESKDRVYYSKFPRIILIPDDRIERSGAISFLMSGLSWKAVAVGQIHGDKLKIRFRAEIKNHTEHTFTSDQLIVVSGGPKGPDSIREAFEYRSRDIALSDQLGGISFKETPDTVRYTLHPTVIGKGNIQVELGRIEVDMNMFYHHSLGDESAGTAIRFKPEHHIPEGIFNLYSSEGYFIGSAPLPRSHKGESVHLKVGSNSVPVESYVQRRKVGNDKEEELWNIKFNNPTNRETKIVVEHPVADNLLDVNPKPVSTDKGSMEWHYSIPPGERKAEIRMIKQMESN